MSSKLYRKSLLASFVILLFLLAPVRAAPSLSLGSTAKYQVSIILHISNGCTADPIEYAGQACNPIIYYRPPGMIGGGGYLNITTFTGNSTIFLQHPSPTITVFDHGACDSANVSCGFYPSYAITLFGNGVSWNNNGTLTHNITSMNTTSSGVPLFNATLPPNHTFIHTFTTPGTYPYYDSSHPSMHGTVSVIAYPNPPPVPIVTYPNPQPTNIQAEIDGTVGWTVVGLDSTNAVLKVDHELALSISPIPGITITPVHESGSFEQSIELNTRLESPGTASAIIARVVEQFLGGLSSLTSGATYGMPASSQLLTQQMSASQKMYTMWWVNGPLVLGSPVKILTGLSSVTGDESVTVDPFGPTPAWLVTSNTTETVKVSIPYSGENQVTSSLKMSWAFDKSNDLLLKSEINGLFASHSTMKQTIWPNPCPYPYLALGTICPVCYTCQSPVYVNVSRDTLVTLDVGMTLTSTSLKSDSARMANLAPNSDPAPLTTMTLLSIGSLGAVAAACVGGGVWFLQRRRGKQSELGSPLPQPTA